MNKDFRYSSMLIYNKCEQLNPDLITNVSYSHIYGKSRRLLEDEFTKEESLVVDKNIASCKKVCQDALKTEFKELEKNILNNYYSSARLEELNQNFILFLNNYFSKSRGPEKLRNLIDFVIEKHPELIRSIAKKIGSENESKLSDLNQKIQNFIAQNEILDNENKHLKEKDEGDYQELTNLKSSLQKANKEIEELKSRIEDLDKENKELKIKANKDLIKYTRNIPELKDQNPNDDNSIGTKDQIKKSKECHCACLII